MLIISSAAFAQNGKKITGVVTDTNNEPLIGVSITVKGGKQGTITDIDGRFSLQGEENQTIVASYVGMTTQEVVFTGKPLTLVMQDVSHGLNEVVVVGYGTMRKKDLTGSVTQIRPDKIAADNPKTVQDILRGTAGLNVGYDSSAKGGGSLSVRGQRSVYTSNNHNSPLLILDGMMFYGELSEINPDDIEQIDILKDASSAAIYGAKAANGVIIITTKKGKQGKPTVNLSVNTGFTQKSNFRDRWSNQSDYLQHYQDWLEKSTYGADADGNWAAYQTGARAATPGYYSNPNSLPSGVDIDTWRGYTSNSDGESDLSIWARRLGFKEGSNALQNLLDGKFVNWEDLCFRTAFNQDYNASVSGASNNANYYLSVGYMDNQGVWVDDNYKTIRANMKVNMNVTKWLELGANVNFQERTDGAVDIDQDAQLRTSPYGDYKDANGKYVQYPLDGNYSQQGYNYWYNLDYYDLEKGYTTFNTIFNAKVKLPFNITYSFNAAPRYQFFHDRYFMSADIPGAIPTNKGVNREQAKRFDWSLNNTVSWNYTFARKHNITLTLVQEAEDRRYWSDRIEARNIQPSDALGFHSTQNGDKEASSFSSNDSHQSADALLARAFYSYNDLYMLTASIRRDGYSAFGSANVYATFPSVALGWTFTNEKFWKWHGIMDYGKLRASYGRNGNRSLDNPYVALSNLVAGSYMGYATGGNGTDTEQIKTLRAERLANPNLMWEKTGSWNFGLDFSFLNGRLSGSLETYFMKTTDMIMNQKIPNFTGFASITTNLGQVNNNGVELTLNSSNIDTENFKWDTNFNFAYNKNTIKHLYYTYEDVTDASGNIIGTKESDDRTNGWFIGQSINEIWDYKVTGIWQKDEWEEAAKYGQVPGDPKVANLYTDDDIINEDGTRTAVYNDKDKTFLGTTVSPFRWSMRNTFTYKNLSLSINMYSYMGQKKARTDYLNNDDDGGRMTYCLGNMPAKTYWTLDNPTNHYARIEAKGPTGAQTPPMIYNGSFIRLDNVTLAYSLPKDLVGKWNIQSAKVYATIKNAAIWRADRHWEYGDIESEGLAVRSYTLGINLSF